MANSSKLQSKGAPLKDDRFPGGLRTGAQYLDALRNDGRRVFVDGEEVSDVTSHPAFADPAKTIACLFDIACDPANANLMTYASPTSGAPVNRIWQMPDSIEALKQRRAAIERWSEESLGYMGRTPDHVAGFFAGFAASPQVLSREGNEQIADNALRIYQFLRDNDVYITYTIVPPQIDRSKQAHQQNPSDLYCGVVKERDDGIVIKGAQMLGTAGTVTTVAGVKMGLKRYNRAIVDGVLKNRLAFGNRYQVNSTPTFIINDEKRIVGAQSYKVFDDLLKKLEK